MNYEITDFEQDVLRRSMNIPVLVDFWAEWCGPCKMLGPILERLATHNTSRWVLAKVDTDKHQDVAARYGVRGIPNVKLFVDGKVKDEFTGALPEHAVAQWLKKTLPNKFDKTITLAEALLTKGDTAEAIALLEGIIQQDPENERARIVLARSLLSSDITRATALVAGVEENSEHFPMADAIRTIGSLVSKSGNPALLPEDPIRAEYGRALQLLAGLQYDAALEKFIGVVRSNRAYDDDGARKVCIAIFRVLGDENPITLKWRREFSSALYS